MPLDESKLEMVTRLVREGHARILNQRALIRRLQQSGAPTTEHKLFLALLEEGQARHIAHLEHLQKMQ